MSDGNWHLIISKENIRLETNFQTIQGQAFQAFQAFQVFVFCIYEKTKTWKAWKAWKQISTGKIYQDVHKKCPLYTDVHFKMSALGDSKLIIRSASHGKKFDTGPALSYIFSAHPVAILFCNINIIDVHYTLGTYEVESYLCARGN